MIESSYFKFKDYKRGWDAARERAALIYIDGLTANVPGIAHQTITAKLIQDIEDYANKGVNFGVS